LARYNHLLNIDYIYSYIFRFVLSDLQIAKSVRTMVQKYAVKKVTRI